MKAICTRNRIGSTASAENVAARTTPAEVLGALGGGGRVPVQATFDGIAYRGSIASMGGCMALGMLKQIRSDLGKGPGDSVVVTVTRDDAERTVEVPDDLAAALAAAVHERPSTSSASATAGNT